MPTNTGVDDASSSQQSGNHDGFNPLLDQAARTYPHLAKSPYFSEYVALDFAFGRAKVECKGNDRKQQLAFVGAEREQLERAIEQGGGTGHEGAPPQYSRVLQWAQHHLSHQDLQVRSLYSRFMPRRPATLATLVQLTTGFNDMTEHG